MAETDTTSIYFVASPLQLLAAKRIASHWDTGHRTVLVWYKDPIEGLVDPCDWDAVFFMPWPRFHPKPGLFGRQKRLLENLQEVAKRCGECQSVIIHSAVFDTEAINYFIFALPRLLGVRRCVARILPDGIISTRRYPLTLIKRMALRLRALRRLTSPLLRYSQFSGDRTGAEAPFVDRIYTLNGFPHEYPLERVVELPRLVEGEKQQRLGIRSALIIDQPLRGFRQMDSGDIQHVAKTIQAWCEIESIKEIFYRAHPKDRSQDLKMEHYKISLNPQETLEVHLARNIYDYVIGVRSTGLLIARQLQPPESRVISFGLDRFLSKSKEEASNFRRLFESMGIEIRTD